MRKPQLEQFTVTVSFHTLTMRKPQLDQFTVTVSFQSHTDNAETAARPVHCDSVLPITH